MNYLLRKTAVAIITGYQKTISPDHGLFKGLYPHGFCSYYPSCSEYTKIAIQQYGVLKGSSMGFWRILRCNPWAKPGVDLVR